MISVIICSVDKTLLNRLKLNIEYSIGVPYEVIAIDNSNTNDGICKVYNRGGALAKFPFLCFIHEDILFQTNNWGQLIINHFNHPKIGLLGIAGGDTKGIVPSSWSTVFKSKEMNLVQHNNKSAMVSGEHIRKTAGNEPAPTKKVVMLDGAFLCTRKKVFTQYKFDETHLKGFHGYDIDYSLQVFCKYEVRVIFDVLIEHYSQGSPGKEWMESALIVTKKWRRNLPLSVYPLKKTEFTSYHWKSLQVFIFHLFRLKYSYPEILYYYFYYSFNKYFTVRRFLSMGKFIIISRLNKPGAQNARKKIKHIDEVRVFN